MYRSDAQQRPIAQVNYQDLGSEASFPHTPKEASGFSNSPSQPGYGQGYRNPPSKKGGFLSKKWVRWGIPLVILIIVGAVLGGVLGSKDSDKKSSDSSSSGSGSGSSSGSQPGSGTGSDGLGSGSKANFVPIGYDNNGNPQYATTVTSTVFSNPTFTTGSNLTCAPFTLPAGFTASTGTLPPNVRTDHPRLWADSARWECVKNLIASDAYLAGWNDTIFQNATKFANMDVTPYDIDGGLGGSGVLDVARQVQLKIKHWGWAWRMSGDKKWADRAWTEINAAAGNDSAVSFGTAGDNWNTQHWLDVGEFTLAFAIAYDWFYDAWTPEQREGIMWSIINLGLNKALAVYNGQDTSHGWWFTSSVNGNWNCVCNGGVVAGALAIYEDDPTGAARTVLERSPPNAAANCVFGASTDGTWSETAAYWYFGTSTMVQMASALETATGNTQGLFDGNPYVNNTGLFHMYVSGNTGMFTYGDTGPNKYTATANSLMYFGRYFDIPLYTLYQRDSQDASEPFSALWYDASVTGSWVKDLPLDHEFPHENHTWVSTRSSWTDTDGFYVAMKGGRLLHHQNHGDLDAGDFVMDALGQRWFGELGSANYLSQGYFGGENQGSDRWLYYRKRTEGQNTIVINEANQNVDGSSPVEYGSTGESQATSGSGDSISLDADLSSTSTSWFWIDMTSYYNETTAVRRGFRYVNGRKQVIIRDEIEGAPGPIQWRAHTNATITIADDGKTANLELGGKKMTVILQSGDGVFTQLPATRYSDDPTLPSGTGNEDQPNDPTVVLAIELAAGSHTIQVLFNPEWDGSSSSSFVTPSTDINLADWSNTSHN